MDRYAPLPTPEQLESVGNGLGFRVDFEHRIEGGLGGTIDVLRVDGGSERVVLRRFWLPEHESEPSPAESEFRALSLAAEHGIPAPAPLWIDREKLFPERAIVISFLAGRPLLDPDDPVSWAGQLAVVLHSIHGIRLTPSDGALFPEVGHDDGPHTSAETLEALSRHPLGQALWARRNQAAESFELKDPVYIHHDFWPGNTLWVDQDLVSVIDWEGGGVGDPALDVAYCAFDIQMLGLDQVADHFVDTYRRISGRGLENLRYWELAALCRPMPDLDSWVGSWQVMGFQVSVEEARARHSSLIATALDHH